MPDQRCAVLVFALALPFAAWPAPHGRGEAPASAADPLRAVTRAEVLAAMKKCGGYSLTATSNNARLQAEVVLRLIHAAESVDAERRPLLIGHREWYEAYLERTGIPPAQAPLAVRISYQLEQDMVADYRREDVLDGVLQGPQPRTVANVWIYWPSGPGRPQTYSYDDKQSTPTLRVTQERVLDYRLVDYEDRLWYAEIHGLRGRPTSGSLGALFALIGEATVVESRSAIAPDGTSVVRGHARKWGFDKNETVTVSRSGRVSQGVPPGRPDLGTLALRLAEPLEIRFRPLRQPGPVLATERALSPS
jgi:hypothetical protein